MTTTVKQPVSVTLLDRWFLALAVACLALPTLISLGNKAWSTETGAQGPIVLFTGLWLLWRIFPQLSRPAKRPSVTFVGLLLIIDLIIYCFGRAYDFLTLEAAGLFLVATTLVYAEFGLKPILRNWFPFLYLSFAIPPPEWLIAQITAPLKQFVASAAIIALAPTGLPIAREGVTILVAQYQLLVEDACSGMNSLIGLTAIGLFYIYLVRRASPLYSLVLVVCVIPIAIFANILRIIVLILITYCFGDAVGQGFLHFAAGIFLFTVALASVFAVDHAISGAIDRRKK